MSVDIGPKISFDGEAEFRSQLLNVNQQLKTLGSEAKAIAASFEGMEDSEEAVSARTDILNRQIETQEKKLAELRKGLAEATKKYGENDTKTLKWAQAVNDATADLANMRTQLENTGNEMDDLGGETKSLTDKLKDLTGIDLGGKLGKALTVAGVATVVKNLAGSLIGLEEETREYRTTMGSLEASSKKAGYTAEETAETYDRLYQVLGDSQTSATTTANLQALGLQQEQLTELVDGAIGAWATYGDSIPIDGLSEAINETIRVGQVTGTFADVLNWGSKENETFGVKLKENIDFTELSSKQLENLTDEQREQYEATKAQYEAIEDYNQRVSEATSAEDLFNIALEDCETQSERVQKVLEVLTQQDLPDTAEQWRNLNTDITNANDAQNRMEEAMGKLGETLSPVATWLTNFGADVIEWLTGKVQDLLDVFQALAGWADKVPEVPKAVMDEYNEYHNVDGSHAGGLWRVPFDGYVAELHRDEIVVPGGAAADQVRAMMTSSNQPATTDFTGLAAGMVNGITTAMSGLGGNYRIEIPISVNGREFSRAIITDLRSVMKSDPEVAKA